MTFVNEWMPDFKIDLVKLYSLTAEEFDKEFHEIEKSVIAEVDKIKAENAKLKKEAEEREKKLAAERKAQEEREAKERAAHEAQLKKEREERAKVEAELKAKQDAEAKAKADEEARLKALKTAPDKDKLRKLAADLLAIEYPEMQSEDGKKVVSGVIELMKKVNIYIIKNVESL